MRLVLAMLLASATAAADPLRALSVQDPSAKLTADVVTTALAGFAVPAACATADRTVVAWVEYERGRVATALVGKGGALEDCVAKALRATRLETGAGRVGVVLAVTVVKAEPPAKVALFETKNRKVLDNLIDRSLSKDPSKFLVGKGSLASGSGPGTGVGPGAGTGTAKGPGGGGKVDGDFVSSRGPIATGTDKRPEIKLATPDVTGGGGLTADEIDRVIRARAGVFRACYQKELGRAAPDLKGKIVTHFVIVEDGHVESVSVVTSTMKSPPVEDCLKANILRLHFPAKGGRANVNYPFLFEQAN